MNFNSAINLNLSAVPDTLVDPRTALAIQPLHYALHAMHKGVSQVTGTWQPSAAEFASIPPASSILTGNHRKIYMVATAAITAGQLVYITAAGMALSSANAAATLPQGWAVQSVANGAVGEFTLFEGLLGVAGAVMGTKYYAGNAAGTVAAAAGVVPMLLGVGVAANLIYMRIPIQ